MSRLLFKLTKDGLIAANTGRTFTVGGLEALCASHRSDKSNGGENIFTSEQDAIEKINGLRNSRLEAYQRCPGDIVEHARAEREMGLDYSNRLLLELMQNADDAAAPQPIGYKGLGFKAVLDVADRAQIQSGYLRVRFDRKESRASIRQAQLPQDHEVPVLRLPFFDTGEFPIIEGAFDTTIFLHWKSADDQQKLFAEEWKRISENPTILLLLHCLEEVVWQPLVGEPTVWHCTRSGTVMDLSIQKGKSEPDRSRWRIFRDPTEKTRSAAVVSLDLNNQPRPFHHDFVRVFFPTEENSPIPLLLHGEFDLEQNRKRVRPGGNRAEVVQSLARCVRTVLSVVNQDGTVLDLLTPRIGIFGLSMLGLEREIWDSIKQGVADVILPESRLKISKVRLCPEAAHGDFSWYGQNRLPNWAAFKQLLQDFRPNGLAGLSLLPPGVDSSSRDFVVTEFNNNASLSIDELRRLPLFPVEGSEMPLATADCRLFFPHDASQTQASPKGIQIGFVRKDFAARCNNEPEIKSFLERLGVSDFTPRAIADSLSAQTLEAVDKGALRQPVAKLYSQTLVKAPEGFRWLAPNPTWSIQKRPDNTEQWHLETSRRNLFFVDRPDLARLRLDGIRTFPVELGWSGNKHKAAQIFGILPLSEHLHGSVEFKSQGTDDELEGRIARQLQERAACLEAYLQIKRGDASVVAEKWKQIEFRVGNELVVTFALDKRELESQPRPTFFRMTSKTSPACLWLDAKENFTDKRLPKDIVWEEIGAALCYVSGLALEDGAVFAALLGCGEDSLVRKLLNLGITEGEIQVAVPKTPWPQPTPKRKPSPPQQNPITPPSVANAEAQPPNTDKGLPEELQEPPAAEAKRAIALLQKRNAKYEHDRKLRLNASSPEQHRQANQVSTATAGMENCFIAGMSDTRRHPTV